MNKYNVYQLQIMDYMLKDITNNPAYAFNNKNLKLVIKFDDVLWHCDFVDFSHLAVSYEYLDTIKKRVTSIQENPRTNHFLSAIKESFTKTYEFSNPLYDSDNLVVLYTVLTLLADTIEIKNEYKTFGTFVYNLVSIDGNSQLPFVDLKDKEFELVTIKEITSPEQN